MLITIPLFIIKNQIVIVIKTIKGFLVRILENNAILDELNSFAFSIKNDEKPKVDIYDGHNALDVAIRIIKNFK